jgi:hypothetical protein
MSMRTVIDPRIKVDSVQSRDNCFHGHISEFPTVGTCLKGVTGAIGGASTPQLPLLDLPPLFSSSAYSFSSSVFVFLR